MQKKYKNDILKKYIPDIYLIEAIGLAHDIGHPPYGHKGERPLNKNLIHFGGFEANGQTLRICTKLGESSENHGLNLTRRTLLGLLKYPSIYSSLVGDNDKEPPKCILDTEEKELDWILKPFDKDDKAKFTSFSTRGGKGHNKTRHKSFDCSIMELADDIAYAVHDLEDSIALKIINRDQ